MTGGHVPTGFASSHRPVAVGVYDEEEEADEEGALCSGCTDESGTDCM